MVGGTMALAGCIVMGPRIGKYVNGKPVAMPGHNIPFVILGTLVLGFGWLGFNPGSTLSGTDLRITFIYVNTVIASVIASIVAMLVMWRIAQVGPCHDVQWLPGRFGGNSLRRVPL